MANGILVKQDGSIWEPDCLKPLIWEGGACIFDAKKIEINYIYDSHMGKTALLKKRSTCHCHWIGVVHCHGWWFVAMGWIDRFLSTATGRLGE